EPPGVGERLHELGRVAALAVGGAPVFHGKSGAQLRDSLADFVQIVIANGHFVSLSKGYHSGPFHPQIPPVMPHVPASTALARFRVLDLSRVRAGPTCVRQLADFGADVVKIEMPPSLEQDTMGGPRHGPDFQNLHRNKRSLTLNLKDKEGVAIFMKLAKTADGGVENYRPDVKFRLGIDYESLKKVNPRIILASISGFGQDGPYRDRPGFDQIAQGMGGFMSVTGMPGQGPVRAGAAIADVSAGLFAPLGVLAAIVRGRQHRPGPWVENQVPPAAGA